VAERAVDLAISHQPQVVLAKENGLDIVAVGSVVPEPTAAMIWLKKSKIGGLADLKGKTIGVYGLSFERGILQGVLARAGLSLDDVKVKKVEHETVPDLVSGRIDATFGNSWNVEGAELEARGLEPVITRVQDLGIPSYDELVVIARSERLRKDPQLIPDFLSAVARGTEAAIKDPEAAVKVIVEERENREENPNEKGIEAAVEATLPLLSRDGYMDPEQASGLIDWMYDEGMIERPLPVSELLTNQYVNEEE
jgi:putative hydroxymethylpyrimidine transport system substrate-binding protein